MERDTSINVMKKRSMNGSGSLVSAGGIVYRIYNTKIQVVICCRNDPSSCNLPKGTPDSGETHEETALREVREETGLEVRINEYIGNIEYEFPSSKGREMLHKLVFYYLMSPIGGDFTLHDTEFDTVGWVDEEKVFSTLTFSNEVEIVQKGLSLVKK